MRSEQPHATDATPEPRPARSEPPTPGAGSPLPPGQQPCPNCGHPMPDLKGGTTSICVVCGFKDSCCY